MRSSSLHIFARGVIAGLVLLAMLPLIVQAQSGEHSAWLPLVFKPPAASNPIHEGIATYYDATGDGACMFGPSPEDLMVAAMNAEEYDNAAVCGAYVHVIGPQGEVTVRIVDLCPECLAGHLDLSREAFALIADLPRGAGGHHLAGGQPRPARADRLSLQRRQQPVVDGGAGAQPPQPGRQARISGRGGQWVAVPRTSYNYFVQTDPGMGPGPYTFRVTDCTATCSPTAASRMSRTARWTARRSSRAGP